MKNTDKKAKLEKILTEILNDKEKLEDKDETINKIIDLLQNYQDETKDYSLEQFIFRFTHYDAVEDYVKCQLDEYWLERLPYLLGEVRDFDERYYIINVYGNLAPVFSGDIEERIDDILYVLRENGNE